MRDPVRRVRFVSNCLYGFSTIWLLLLLFIGGVDIERHVNGKPPGRQKLLKYYAAMLTMGPVMVRISGARAYHMRVRALGGSFAIGLTGMAISAIGNAAILIGASRMRRLKNYRLAIAAGVLAVIPHTAPFVWLGMLVGGYALWTLTRPEVRTAFTDPGAQARARTALEQQLVHRSALPYLLGVLAALVILTAVNWVIGYVLLTHTELAHRLAWPVTGYLGTVLSQIGVFAGMYLYLRQRRGHDEAVRGTMQGPFFLLGVDDRRRTDALSFCTSVIVAGLFVAGPAAFFSHLARSPGDALSIMNLIVIGSPVWGIVASLFLWPRPRDS